MSGGAETVRLVGRYALYQAIASGGMATVYLGRLLGPVGFARTVAIKRLLPHYADDPKFVAMFLDEARLAARIRHPNVVPTLDVVATSGELFLVMEYVHGESLAKLIRVAAEQEVPIPIPVVVSIMSGALQGLHAAHEAKSDRGVPLQIIHRDVSPQNILLGRDGQARLLDFGVARAEERLHKTQEGLVKGKVAYMAPEQLRGETIGPPTDVYAAAVVMWEALVGHRLFMGAGEGGLVVDVLEARVRPPSEALLDAGQMGRAAAAKPLDEILMRAFSKAMGERWQTARDLARALEGAVVPATAAQVSDWVETVAGVTLRDRASIVAEMENSSAAELTHAELGAAMAGSHDAPGKSEVPSDEPLTVANVPPAEVPKPAPTEPVLTAPLSTDRDSTRPPFSSGPPFASGPVVPVAARPTDGSHRSTPPPPVLATLLSAQSPMAGKSVRPPALAATLQSASPFAGMSVPPPPKAVSLAPGSGAVMSEAPRTSVAPPSSLSAPSAPPRSRTGLKLLAAVVVVAAAGGGYAIYVQSQATGQVVRPPDTKSATPRSGLERPDTPEKPAER